MTAFEGIVAFNLERKLLNFNAPAEYAMLFEELQEFLHASSQENDYETVDALADLIVIAAGGLFKLGYDPEKVLLETVKEINSRQGTFDPVAGKWQKDPLQDSDTLYKANYSKAIG